MHKTIAIILLIVLTGGIYYFIDHERSSPKTKSLSPYQKVMSHDLEENYPSSPYEVMIMNNHIITYLYGLEIKEEEIPTVINQQRYLFSPELLELNPEDVQVEKIVTEIKAYKEQGFKIIRINSLPVEYNPQNVKLATVKVIQFTNAPKNNYLKYVLEQQINGEWKILGWKSTDQFEIPEA
jgi:hypothetical protein